MSIVCIDTNILIWGIKKQATEGQENKIDQAERFLKHLDSKGNDIIVPSLVVAELLMNIPNEQKGILLNKISKSFRIVAFDTISATLYSTIWFDLNRDNKELINKSQLKNEMKIDCMIIAIAKTNNAECDK